MDAEPTYTVFIRLPFPRNQFVDPPPIRWDATKDEALWKILSSADKTDIDWTALAENFQVTVDFLLQQTEYLTDRHATQLRAQMRKAAMAKGSSAASPVPGSDSATAEAMMRRTDSSAGRAPSALSIRKDGNLPRNNEANIPGTPGKSGLGGRPQVSRNSSAATSVGTHNKQQAVVGGISTTPRPGAAAHPSLRPGSRHSTRSRLSSLPITAAAAVVTATGGDNVEPPSPGPEEEDEEESSSAASSSSSSPIQSRIIRRPPRFHQQQHQDTGGSLADEEDEAEPAFLPFRPQSSSGRGEAGHRDLGATLRGDPAAKDRTYQSQTSDSSASSVAARNNPQSGGGGSDRRPGPLSPRRAAELSGRSPRSRNRGVSREGSDGTPSMGSSFSDLDDASVTQSALEEALASKMNDGTIGSRMSNFSQAFRSRYLPKGGRS